MQKRSKRIIILSSIGIVVGLWDILIGGFDLRDIGPLTLGSICIFLSFGIFMLWNWARISAFIFSFMFIGIYIMLIIATIMHAFQGFAGVALFLHFPHIILSLLFIDNLNRKGIKAQFKKQTKN